jgi:cytochrome c oxidase assembly protein subunit 15
VIERGHKARGYGAHHQTEIEDHNHMRASISENLGLHRFALFTACCTAFLIFVGGLVTSTESGLAVPDWPLSYGMFFPPMVGGIFYEHGHRMVASFVGLLTVILAVWTCLKERRRWVRRLSVLALVAVITQGILGGLTVLYLLPTPISVTHALLAQTFFCLTIALALFTSPGWKRGLPAVKAKAESITLPTLCAMTTGAVYAQLILGALMRHTKSGLAIPDFPLAFGRLIPPLTSDKVVIHFAHRLGAVIVTAMILWTFSRIVRSYRDHRLLYRPALAMLMLVSVQLTLGALTIWTGKAVIPTTAHVATGALVLGASFLLTVRAFTMVVAREPAWK